MNGGTKQSGVTRPEFETERAEQLSIGAPVSFVKGDTAGLFAGVPKAVIDEWRAYHKANPWIWERFRKYAHELRMGGVKRAGARMIMERVRWDVSTKAITVGDFAVQNNWIAFYARLLTIREGHLF